MGPNAGYTPQPMTRRASTLFPAVGALALISALAALSCTPDAPPAPRSAAKGSEMVAATVTYDGKAPAVLTYAGERGVFADAPSPTSIPAEAKGFVRVKLLDGPEPPRGKVFVANLTQARDAYALKLVARDAFEELALGDGRSSKIDLPAGLELPDVSFGDEIIVYKTAWCGVCSKLTAYLDNKGVEYVAKDIEKDRDAAAELQAKAKKKGVQTGSVPVIDVGGELMVGFDRARLEKMLGPSKPPPT